MYFSKKGHAHLKYFLMSQKFKALELFLFSSATIPEKYFEKLLTLKLFKLVLLE